MVNKIQFSTYKSVEKVLNTVQKSFSDDVRIKEVLFRGKKYIDLRIYTKTDKGEIVPTQRGIILPIPKMRELIKKLVDLKI